MANRIVFHKLVQDGLEFGSNERVSVSRVYFDLIYGEDTYPELYVDIEEPAGGTHDLKDVQVGAFKSPVELDRKAFEEAVCRYYQSLVTSAGYGKHLAKDKGMRSHGDVLGLEQVFTL